MFCNNILLFVLEEQSIDVSISIGESLIKSLFLDCIEGDLLELVHLSNSFTRIGDNITDGEAFFNENEEIQVSMQIVEIANIDSGQKGTS